MATADTPDKEVVSLIAGAQVAIEEEHVPRSRGIKGIRRRRPIEVRLDANKRMARRKVGIPNRRIRIH